MKVIIAIQALIFLTLSQKSSAAKNEGATCECGIANEPRVRRSNNEYEYRFNRGVLNRFPDNLPQNNRLRRQAVRIVGGTETNKNKYPWLVSVVMKLFGKNSKCGGSIINTRYVLTAGHCTYAGLCVSAFKASDIYVTVAEHNINSINDDVKGVTETLQAQKIIRHPEYCLDPNALTSYNNDLAILLLPKDLDLSHKELGLPCLPDSAWSTFEGKTVTVAGWGLNQASGAAAGTTAEKLLEVSFKVQNDCRGYKYGHHITNNMMCAGDTGAVKDACGGDSGGPLVYKNENNRYVQVGIVSFGPPGGNCTGLGVYTQVAHYIDWIRDITQDGQCQI